MPAIMLRSAVGKGQPNLPDDVKTVSGKLVDAGFLPCKISDFTVDEVLEGIKQFQACYMPLPDQVVSVGGQMAKFLGDWSIKPINPGVQLPGRLKTAWDLVNPFLPPGSTCTSGFRSADDQRRILHGFYNTKYRTQIIAKYGQAEYTRVGQNLLGNEDEVLKMVRACGQAISKPGQSKHQQGKAIDLGGPADNEQVRVIKMIATANPTLLSGFVLKEANGCVHFELR